MNLNMTLVGQTIAFIVFALFCIKYIWPPLIKAIEDRQKMIKDGLASAERAGKGLELAQANAKEQIKVAKGKAAKIIEQANKRKTQIIDEATQSAQVERLKILSQAKAEIEAERNRVREELRKKVAALAISGAEKILARQIDEAANSDIVEKIVAEL